MRGLSAAAWCACCCRARAGIGQYDLEAAWRLDTLLALGHSLGIRSLISLHTFNYFRTSDYYACVAGGSSPCICGG